MQLDLDDEGRSYVTTSLLDEFLPNIPIYQDQDGPFVSLDFSIRGQSCTITFDVVRSQNFDFCLGYDMDYDIRNGYIF